MSANQLNELCIRLATPTISAAEICKQYQGLMEASGGDSGAARDLLAMGEGSELDSILGVMLTSLATA